MIDKGLYLETVIRSTMESSGMNTYELAEISGVAQAVIWRFLNRQRGINLTTASRIAVALDLELRPKRGKVR
jgi:plasmid maintenance system antidote protein VapI